MCWKREYYHPRAVEHIARLLEEGFQPDDLFLTLGYFPGRQPSSRAAAQGAGRPLCLSVRSALGGGRYAPGVLHGAFSWH